LVINIDGETWIKTVGEYGAEKDIMAERDEVTRECRRLYSSLRILPSGGFALTVVLVRDLIACHVFSASAGPISGHPVNYVAGALKRTVTRNQ